MFRRTWRIKSWRPTSGWSRYLPNIKSLLIYLPLNTSNFSSGFPPIKVLVRLQTHVGAIRVRWGEHAPRSVRSHLEAGHQPLQQVSRFVSLVYYTCRPAELQQQTRVRESLTSLLQAKTLVLGFESGRRRDHLQHKSVSFFLFFFSFVCVCLFSWRHRRVTLIARNFLSLCGLFFGWNARTNNTNAPGGRLLSRTHNNHTHNLSVRLALSLSLCK
jgi:hypothetical protein